ncbi:MAG: alpha-amylase family glycosyl hydrolase [Pirellulales bacterium]
MSDSIWDPDITTTLTQAAVPGHAQVAVGGQTVRVPTPFPSPADWRDHWIYFLLVDRFHNPAAPPRQLPFDGEHGVFQGGTLEGVRQQLDYLRDLGVGAIWLSPILKNCAYEDSTYHGYGFQDFLRVDPRFTSDPAAARLNPRLADDELRRLVDAAHARGIYVIFDIVLNHVGNVFAYEGSGATAEFRSHPYPIRWRDEAGQPTLAQLPTTQTLAADAAVWPSELQRNELFRRQGKGGEEGGDFESLKELVTDFRDHSEFGNTFPVRQTLIRAYQYLIARFDVDGFRIDTLKYIEPEFARLFGNAIREYAQSIGKRNFFTFGEVFDGEEKIAGFIGRNAGDVDEPVGVDAALDFPLFFTLPSVVKGFAAPVEVDRLYRRRKEVQRNLLTTHGEASAHFVTFLDNHDMRERLYFRDPTQPSRFDPQLTLAVACLFTLQGIPCLYYGTEQGLHGRGGRDLAVREALWGKQPPFDPAHPFYRTIARLTALRNAQPALRYGRQYFRPLSGDGVHFGISPFPAGVLAYSRILNDQEVLVVANTQVDREFRGEVLVDASLHPAGAACDLLFSNQSTPTLPTPVQRKSAGAVEIHESGGGLGHGPASTVGVVLRPLEIQLVKKRPA